MPDSESPAESAAANPAVIADLMTRYRAGAAVLRAAIEGLSPESLRARPIPGKMSSLEVVCHIVDADQFMCDRMKRTIATDLPLSWESAASPISSGCSYQDRDPGLDVRLLEVQREQMLADLESCPPAPGNAIAIHSEVGRLTLFGSSTMPWITSSRMSQRSPRSARPWACDLVKRIGVLGGMSWESSVEYERVMNTAVRERLGGSHSADLILRSYDFAEIEALQEAAVGTRSPSGSRPTPGRSKPPGRSCWSSRPTRCTSLHRGFRRRSPSRCSTSPMPPPTPCTPQGWTRSRLLGTRYTMELGFYRDRLAETGITALVPDEPDARSFTTSSTANSSAESSRRSHAQSTWQSSRDSANAAHRA